LQARPNGRLIDESLTVAEHGAGRRWRCGGKIVTVHDAFPPKRAGTTKRGLSPRRSALCTEHALTPARTMNRLRRAARRKTGEDGRTGRLDYPRMMSADIRRAVA